MPGNDVGDRVHNFFAQDSFSQGQNHSPTVDGQWPALSNNLWVGSQRQTGVPSLNSKSHNSLNSDNGKGPISYPFTEQHGLNFTQSTSRPDFATSQSQSQQANLNGYMHGNHFYQTGQDEANFLAVDAGSDQHNLASGGSSVYESQQGPRQQARAPVRSEPSESPGRFDLFGGQQMNRQQSNMLHSFQRQQSGLTDVQQLQQQIMFMKMQELQRQQQLQQLDSRQQNTLNQVSTFSSSHSPALVNGTTNSGALGYPWASDVGNTEWFQRGSSFQGSSNALNPTNNGQGQHLMGLIPQPIDQSLYGVPVPGSRGSLNLFSQEVTEKPMMQPMAAFNSSYPVNQYAALADQADGHDGTSIPRQRFQGEKSFGHAPSQAQTNAINMENLQQAQKNSALKDFGGRQDLAVPSDITQEKAEAEASSSQNEVGLDPTEERILFGSDDNIWAAFGKSSSMSGEGGNPFECAGSWSALMQSAVAETSSSDLGVQEGSVLNLQSTEIPSRNQNLMYNSGSHETSSAAGNFSVTSSLNSVSVRPSDHSNRNSSYHNVQGHRFPYEPGQSLPANSSQRLVQSSKEGSKWSNFGPLQKSIPEVSQMFGINSHPLETEKNTKRVSSPLTPDLGGVRQLCHKSAGWKDVESVPSGDAALSASRNSSKHSQDDNQMKFQAEVVHGSLAWKSKSGHNSTFVMEHVRSSVATPQVNAEVFSFHNSGTVPNSSTMRGGEETSQLQNNYQSNYWENTDPLVKSKVNDGLGVLHSHVTEDNQISHSSLGIDDKEVRMHEMESRGKEDSNYSYCSNLFPNSSAGGVRENILSDASDSRYLPTGKHKSSNQVCRKNSWPRKFQYHPMGNLDEDLDPPYGRKQLTHSQSIVQQKNAHHVQSKVFGQIPKIQTELEKGQSSDAVRDDIGIDEVHSQNSFHGGGSNITGPFNRSVDLYSPNKAAQSSQNMLLLQKVDESRERGSMAHFSNSEHKESSKVPETENSDEFVGHLQRNQSSASQGFGLQLGPPSRRTSVRHHHLLSQSPIQAVSSSHPSHAAEIGESQGQMFPVHHGQSLHPSELSQEDLKNNKSGVPRSTSNETSLYAMPGDFSSAFDSDSGSPYLRSPLQNPPVIREAIGQVSTNQSIGVSFDNRGSNSTEKGDSGKGPASCQSVEASLPGGAGHITQDNFTPSTGKSRFSNADSPHGRLSVNQVSSKAPLSVSQPFSMAGISQQGASSKMFSDMWPNFPPPQPLFGAQSSNEPSHIHQSHQLNIIESSLSAPERKGDQDANRGTFTPEFDTRAVKTLGYVEGKEQRAKECPTQQVPFRNNELVQQMNDSQGRETIVKNLSEGSANFSSVQKDNEVFGRSLKSNNLSNQEYSLLNQMQAMNHVETDPSNKSFKGMRVSDSSTGTQQVRSTESKMVSISGPELQRSVLSQQAGTQAPQNVLAFHHDDSPSSSHNNITNFVKPEHTQISPQMAPSWFNQYGTFTNGQMYDARRAVTMRTTDQSFTLGKSSSGLHAINSTQQVIPEIADRSPIDNLGSSSIPCSAAIEQFSSPQTLPLIVSQQHQLLKPKKRKRATSELTPWYKEVSLDSLSNQTISLAETEWAKAVNRLIEKVKEDSDLIEGGSLRIKVKRRIVLTTQLMQQLFRPSAAAILSADANLEYASVAYSISRLALGDACSMVSCSNGDSDDRHDCKELFPDKGKTFERNVNHFAKVVEELTVRARKLESDFLRLEKQALVLDVIVEGQDLEKFSVINRFAKFHGRGQSNGIETSSSSDAHSHKPYPQRYVTALPMPKNIPNMVQCLSL